MILGRRLPPLVLVLALLGMLLGTLPALAVSAGPLTYVVTNNLDNVNDVNCQPAPGSCTLRQAVNASNANDPGAGNQNAITFAAGVTGAITLSFGSSGTLILSKDVTITGPGATVLAIDGGCTGCDPGGTPSGGVQVFVVGSTVTATIGGLTIRHGHASDSFGGGISNQSGRTLTLRDDLIASNVANLGGGIFNLASTLIVDRTTFEGNTGGQGGGIFNNAGGTLTVTNSTFANNQSQIGGAIFNYNQASVTNTTIARNVANLLGGGIFNNGGPLTLTGSIVAGNSGANGPDVSAQIPVTDGGYNLIGSPAGNAFVDGTNHDRVGTAAVPLDPKLTALGSFGGTTPTFALLPGSPALDTIPTGTLGCGSTLASDQRGIARPQPTGGSCDSGAFESRGFTLAVASGSPQSAVVGQPFAAPLAVMLSSNDGVTSLNGVPITFAAPASGASAILGTPNPAMTNASGQASVTATANGTVGGPYTVTASIPGIPAATFSLTNTAPTITLSPTTLPSGTAEQPYSQQLSASGTGSIAPYTFAITTGQPSAGLILDPNGLLHGTPILSGGFPITVTATDANGFTGIQGYLLTIAAPTITLSPTTLPGGAKGVAYPATTITASGGVAPYAFTLRAGTLPDGLTLDILTGVLSGTPTATGTFSFTVTATDQSVFAGTQAYTITVTAAPLVSIAVAPNPTTVKVGQVQQFTATGTYADSSTTDLTSQVTWTSDASSTISVDTSGKGTGMSAGTAHLTATQGSISGQATVTVGTPILTGVQPAPAPASRPSGASTSGTPAPAPVPSSPPTTGGSAPVAAPTGR